jgi:hypothetical protein
MYGAKVKITVMCLVLFCLHVEEPVFGSEEGGSQLMHNTENFFILFVCLFTVGCSTLD